MALDEPKETDDVFEVKGYKFLVEKSLMKTVAPVTVDLENGFFSVQSSLKANKSACGSCSSC